MPEWLIRDSRSPEMVLHPSTEGALMALKGLSGQYTPHNMLDLGCGSGLLSIVAAEFWPKCRIIATDISPKAVEDASHNMREFGLESRITVLRADTYQHPEIRARAPYDLIACNLLADILIKASPALWDHLQPGGVAVLSGILAWMLPQVVEAHAALGFEITGEIEMTEWRTLIVRRPGTS